jgi:hypothetical protein
VEDPSDNNLFEGCLLKDRLLELPGDSGQAEHYSGIKPKTAPS